MSNAAAPDADAAAVPDLLAVLLDTNPFAWHASGQSDDSAPDGPGEDADSLSFDEALKSVLVLCNAHMALRHENHIAFYTAGVGHSSLLYSSIDAQIAQAKRATGDNDVEEDSVSRKTTTKSDSNSYQTFRIVDEAIGRGIRETMAAEEAKPGMQDKPVAFSSGLSKALCYINRLSKDESLPPMKARILVVSVSGETSSQYIPIMNCIFAAQKNAIPIDVCKVYGEATVFLQQAAHLTKASYHRLERRADLLQYLIMAFLPGIGARRYLQLPSQDQIDLRAACFCHKKIVDIGYVCSVCLSIFCSPIPVCSTCRTRFPIASLRRLMGTGGAALGNGAGGPAGGAKKRKAGPASGQVNGATAARVRTSSAAPSSAPGTPA